MLTCSSVGPSADGLGDELGVTVLRVDEAMAERAVELGPSGGRRRDAADDARPDGGPDRAGGGQLGRPVEVTTRLAEGAFDALRSGDGARHDALVMAALRELAADGGRDRAGAGVDGAGGWRGGRAGGGRAQRADPDQPAPGRGAAAGRGGVKRQ